MYDHFLFRFDGARDNNPYIEIAQERGFVVFAGTAMQIGPWTPDFMRVMLDEDGQNCEIAIIELEANATAARISARKYLPESSQLVIEAFLSYIDRICIQCRTTADPRLREFINLKAAINNGPNLTVLTAGSLKEYFDKARPFLAV